MLAEHERFIEYRIRMRGIIEPAAVQLVLAVTHTDVMAHPDCGIVHQSPPGAANGEAERELPV